MPPPPSLLLPLAKGTMGACGVRGVLWGTRGALGTKGASSLSRGCIGPRPLTLGLLEVVPSTPPPSLFRRSFDEDFDRDFRDLNWYWASEKRWTLMEFFSPNLFYFSAIKLESTCDFLFFGDIFHSGTQHFRGGGRGSNRSLRRCRRRC